jgi:hypothetical protein
MQDITRRDNIVEKYLPAASHAFGMHLAIPVLITIMT